MPLKQFEFCTLLVLPFFSVLHLCCTFQHITNSGAKNALWFSFTSLVYMSIDHCICFTSVLVFLDLYIVSACVLPYWLNKE